MAIKFEKITPGMTLFDIHRETRRSEPRSCRGTGTGKKSGTPQGCNACKLRSHQATSRKRSDGDLGDGKRLRGRKAARERETG